MTKYHYVKVLGVRLKWWVFRCKYSLSKNGKWPVSIRLTDRGIAYHGGKIADLHIEIE